MKLRKLKTTIISSLAFIPLFTYANIKSVVEQGNYYFIATEVEKVNRTSDMRRAAIKAKAELVRYLKPKAASVTAEMRHFQLIHRKENANTVTYRFKIDRQEVHIVE